MQNYAALFTGNAAPAPENEVAAPYRILLADDEPNVLKALQRVFRQEHYEVETAANGQEALKLVGQGRFDLVISDYMMPGMSGAELLRQVKAVQPDAIRIMLTGHADTAAVMGAINEGAVYKFILKPWNDDDLRVTVALALEQHDLIQKNRQLQRENTRQSKEIGALARMAVSNRSRLAIMLHKRKLLTDQQVQEAHRLQQSRKEPIVKVLLERGWVTERALRDILHKDFLFEEVALAEFRVDPAVAALIPHSYCERQCAIPLKLDERRGAGKTLLLAVADPLDDGLVEDLRFVAGLDVKVVMADVAAIRAKIAEVYGESEETSLAELETLVSGVDPYEGIEVVIDDDEDTSLEDLLRETEEPPAIRLVNAIVLEAIRLGASDIHVQPRTKNVVVRYRIDGVLADKIHIPSALHSSLLSRLKVMAALDISERRRPQDGRITVKTPLRIVDMRISTLPTINGEKAVMRLLDRNSPIKSVEALGFSAGDMPRVLRMVGKPQGIVLATGPTGSGKTTTLYGLLQHNATPEKNYVTIEDPVEYYLDMAGQVLIREKIGLTFPAVLRSILRQDPDVILIGEIRDLDTAEVAFHAALTGHQVFSTLHTNSAVATLSRLFDLGMKPIVVASALEGVIAQRLVRRICDECRAPDTPAAEVFAQMGLAGPAAGAKYFKGKGCPRCQGSGYRGRLGIYEVMAVDDELRHLIASGTSMLDIGLAARKKGMTSLLEDALGKVEKGLTTLDDVLRVLGPQ